MDGWMAGNHHPTAEPPCAVGCARWARREQPLSFISNAQTLIRSKSQFSPLTVSHMPPFLLID